MRILPVRRLLFLSLFLSAARSPVGLTSFSPSTLSLASFCHFFFRILCPSVFAEFSRLEQILFESSPFFSVFFSFLFFWRKWKLRLHAECKKLRTYKILRDPESQLSIILRQASSFSIFYPGKTEFNTLLRHRAIFSKASLSHRRYFRSVVFYSSSSRTFFSTHEWNFQKSIKKRERERGGGEERKSDELDDRWLFTISRDGRMIPVIREHQSVNGLSIVLEKPKGRGDRALVSVAGSYETNICALDGNAYAECRMRKNA